MNDFIVFLLFSIFVLQVVPQNPVVPADLEEALIDLENAVQPIFIECMEALNQADASDEIPKIIEDLQKLKDQGDQLLKKFENNTSIILKTSKKANLDILEQTIKKVTQFLKQLQDQTKKSKRYQSAGSSQPENLPDKSILTTVLKDDFSDLAENITSSTQTIVKTCFQSFLLNVPSR